MVTPEFIIPASISFVRVHGIVARTHTRAQTLSLGPSRRVCVTSHAVPKATRNKAHLQKDI